MKKRRLPETEIANLAFQPREQKERALEAWLKPRKVVGSYEPFRNSLADALNAQLPLIKSAQKLSELDKVEQAVLRRCHGNAELVAMNMAVTIATHDFAAKNDVVAYPLEARALHFPDVQPYEFSLPMVAVYAGDPHIVYLDIRRTGNLTPHARHVVFSAQHARIRERYPELSSARLETWRYRNRDDRAVQVFAAERDDFFSFEDLAADFAETVSILNSLREGEQADVRTWNRSDPGPLFGTGR